jgi:DNA-binding transcriptional LysR family regulator
MNLESVDLNLLLTLHHVAAEGSVSAAAARLHVTPSAVSNSLARLRDLLGDPLFVRRGRGLVATPRMLELAPQLAAAVDSLRTLVEADARFDPAQCGGEFSVASADNIGSGALPAVVRLFAERMPNAKLRLVTLDHAVAGDGLATGDIDVLLGLPPMTPDLRSQPVYRERLLCAVWHDNPHVGRRMSLRQFLRLRHVAVVLQGKHPIDFVDTVLSKLGHARSIVLSVPQFMTAATCIVGTPYVAMVPETMARELGASLPLRICEPPVPLPAVTLLQVWHRRTDQDPASRFFRKVIADALAPTLAARGRRRASRRPSRESADAAHVHAHRKAHPRAVGGEHGKPT